MKLGYGIVTGRVSQRGVRFAGKNFLGIPTAWAAFFTHVRFFVASRPSTPLRVFSLIAVSAALRSRGIILATDRRQALIELMELGALLNDQFDGNAYDPVKLRASIVWFAGSRDREVVRTYAKRLRHLERTRPSPDDSGVAVRIYRENVNRISLAALWALATHGRLGVAVSEVERETDLRLLFRMIMLLQVIDDVLDIHVDRRRGLPSLATAADASAPGLLAQVSLDADSYRIKFDQDFCLRVALQIIAAIARLVIGIRGRAVGGSNFITSL